MQNKKTLAKILSILVALIIWQLVSMSIGVDFILASPIQVVKKLFVLLGDAKFFKTVLFSLLRIGLGFVCAFAAGNILAILAGRFRLIETFLWPYVTAVKTVPIASFAILALIWFDYNELTVFISFLIAFPVIHSNVLQGIKSADEELLEMAEIYRVSWWKKFIYIYLPSIKPFIVSSCSVAIGMAWKAGVAAEVIGIINGSIGEALYQAKIYFQNDELLAWTIVIILLSVCLEKFFAFIVKRFYEGLERI